MISWQQKAELKMDFSHCCCCSCSSVFSFSRCFCSCFALLSASPSCSCSCFYSCSCSARTSCSICSCSAHFCSCFCSCFCSYAPPPAQCAVRPAAKFNQIKTRSFLTIFICGGFGSSNAELGCRKIHWGQASEFCRFIPQKCHLGVVQLVHGILHAWAVCKLNQSVGGRVFKLWIVPAT